ncbi:hypothetical protein IV38_GL001118 [Lactobacillus selangorensis]|uniref:D-3-phosphoglycerate dehydrogenase n=1 Tax=Lactobacillus selangorensis TaxID=81857 RepID=A0A0R2FKY8_9LACO|nr:NAD(P)-dependent oxidoreductase [Lactobacillus selangorensis]KRN28910.1 hypothetical protein IV38_GL001118 [Lactobacillus selangorensis]KRN32680.1 hypothetical protein IV40_GL000735 [Lactobacillus selangorensis]
MTQQKVIIPNTLAQAGQELLTAHGYAIIPVNENEPSDIIEKGRDADAIILTAAPFSNDTIAELPHLKIIARHGVGHDNVDSQYAAAHGIWVTNTPLANATTVAETTLADILLLSKHLYHDTEAMRHGDWNYPRHNPGMDLMHKTIGIIGYGHIGQHVAQLVRAFKCNVLVWDRKPKEIEYGRQVARDEVFAKSDFVTTNLAAVPATIHSIGAHEFALMKASAYFLNLSRGAIVDTNALVDALENEQIAGAALDVFEEEPLPMDSPLYKLDNVFLTPHMAANTTEAEERMATGAASEVDRVLSGQEPQWPLNTPKK